MRPAPRLRGPDGFEEYYARQFGPEWPELRAALLKGPEPVARRNRFALPEEPREWIEYAGGPIERTESGLCAWYVLDLASIWAARSLEVQPGERVLDLCAAPGGKTLILAEALATSGELTANDRSPARAQRLRRVIVDYVPEEVRARIRLTQRDARRWGLMEPESYDAVLLDAPCSSEGHVLRDAGELAKWSEGRVERLALEQYSLITSALMALKPGGRLLYSTCALAPLENDGVVRRLLERGRHPARVDPVSAPVGAATELGWQMLPHRDGCGPLYFCRLVKG